MTRRRLLAALALVAVVGNLVPFLHAWRFTHFVASGERTRLPVELSLAGRAWVLLTGVTVPRPTITRTPADLGLVAEEVTIAGLSAWRIEGSGAGTVALFHGYGGSRSQLLPQAAALLDLGFTTVLVDFPGSGGSPGDRTTLGWSEAEAVRDVAASLPRPRALYGQSMGAAAILRAVGVLGAQADALVLESPFDRLVTTVGHRFHAMGLPAWPGAPLLVFWGGVQGGFDGLAHAPVDYARGVRVPTLLLVGGDDPWVRVDEVQAIQGALAGHAELRVLPGAGHGDLLGEDPEGWRAGVEARLRDLGTISQPPGPSRTPPAAPAVQACASAAPVEILDFPGSCSPPPGAPAAPEDVDVANPERTGAAHTPRPALPDASYDTLLQVLPSSLGAARVRSRLVFQASDERNVLTSVPDCTVLRVAGPMKNSSGSLGLGWSVRLRDPTGQTCQGFVSDTVLGPPAPVLPGGGSTPAQPAAGGGEG